MWLSTELPVTALDLYAYNDFDFLLSHLIIENKEYRDFYITHRRNRFVMVDCSLIEKGTAINDDGLYDAAIITKANEVIAPDALGNLDETLKRTHKFCDKYFRKLTKYNIKIAGVIQGKTLDEVMHCYDQYRHDSRISTICIPFGLKLLPISDQTQNQMSSRIAIVSLINRDRDLLKNFHLLGVNTFEEFKYYHSYSWIRSVDTSAPIIVAMRELDLTRYREKLQRPYDYFTHSMTQHLKNRIIESITWAKEVINGKR